MLQHGVDPDQARAADPAVPAAAERAAQVHIMTNVAAFINESKRRKDIGMYTRYDM